MTGMMIRPGEKVNEDGRISAAPMNGKHLCVRVLELGQELRINSKGPRKFCHRIG